MRSSKAASVGRCSTSRVCTAVSRKKLSPGCASAHALTYEGTYWKWVERSWRSGLRMMVTLLVDNEVLCNLQTNRVNPCDDMEGAKLQRKRLY